jgi:hypothetical protein
MTGRNGLTTFYQYAASHDWIIASTAFFNPYTDLIASRIKLILKEVKNKGLIQ